MISKGKTMPVNRRIVSNVHSNEVLGRDFYRRPTVEVARDLLGKILVYQQHAGRITEVEAYLASGDKAAHSSRGRTRRTEVIFGPPGHAYVYLVYGMHECFNVVVEEEGTPGCVLIRAVENCSGPGRLTRAMGIDRSHYGADLTKGPITIRSGGLLPGESIVVTPRIGIREDKDLLLRFVLTQETHKT